MTVCDPCFDRHHFKTECQTTDCECCGVNGRGQPSEHEAKCRCGQAWPHPDKGTECGIEGGAP